MSGLHSFEEARLRATPAGGLAVRPIEYGALARGVYRVRLRDPGSAAFRDVGLSAVGRLWRAEGFADGAALVARHHRVRSAVVNVAGRRSAGPLARIQGHLPHETEE